MAQLAQSAGRLCRSGSSLCRTCPNPVVDLPAVIIVTFSGISLSYDCPSAPLESFYWYESKQISGWPTDLFPSALYPLRNASSQAYVSRSGADSDEWTLTVKATAEFEESTGVWTERTIEAQWEGTAVHLWSPSISVAGSFYFDEIPDLDTGDPVTPATITWVDPPDAPDLTALGTYLFATGDGYRSPQTWGWPTGIFPDSLYATRDEGYEVSIFPSGTDYLLSIVLSAEYELTPGNWTGKYFSIEWMGSSLTGSYAIDWHSEWTGILDGEPASSVSVAVFS